MSSLYEFCEERGLTLELRDAFVAYCRSKWASKFMVWKHGETSKLLAEKMTQRQIDEMWLAFIADLKKSLTK